MQWARRREKALDRAYRAAGERRALTGRDADGARREAGMERRERAGVAARETEAGAEGRRETSKGDRRETAEGDRRETAEGDRRETVAGDSGERQGRETVAHGRRTKFLEAERVRLHLERSGGGAVGAEAREGAGPCVPRCGGEERADGERR